MVNNHPPEKIRFKVGDIYSNAIGQYKILSLSDSTMQVEYSDGTISTLTISVQQRVVSRVVSRAMREADIRMLAEVKERDQKKWAPAMRKADMEQGWFPADH